MKTILAAAVAVICLAGTAAADDPLTGTAERFFSLRPGGSAPAVPADFGGSKCEGLEPGTHVWWGRFAGSKAEMRRDDKRYITHTSEGCFRSADACEAWMIALKTKYNARPIYNHCQPVYDPGAPVPPWWAPRT